MKAQGYARGNILGAFSDGPTTALSDQEAGTSGSRQGYFAQVIGGHDGETEVVYGYVLKGLEGIEIDWMKAPEAKDGKAIDLRIVMNDGCGEELELKELF